MRQDRFKHILALLEDQKDNYSDYYLIPKEDFGVLFQSGVQVISDIHSLYLEDPVIDLEEVRLNEDGSIVANLVNRVNGTYLSFIEPSPARLVYKIERSRL